MAVIVFGIWRSYLYLLLSSIISAPVLADATTPAADSTTEINKNTLMVIVYYRKGGWQHKTMLWLHIKTAFTCFACYESVAWDNWHSRDL